MTTPVPSEETQVPKGPTQPKPQRWKLFKFEFKSVFYDTKAYALYHKAIEK